MAAFATWVLLANAALTWAAARAAPWAAGWRVALPMAPFTLSSPALCLLLVFRTNAAYSRWCACLYLCVRARACACVNACVYVCLRVALCLCAMGCSFPLFIILVAEHDNPCRNVYH
jgi:hypothetical protein